MKFNIEQIALAPKDPKLAEELLSAMSESSQFIRDHVTSRGMVRGEGPFQNEANLAFNYDLGPAEVEVIEYTKGRNWLEGTVPRVSHLGMHCANDEVDKWQTFFAGFGINVAQAVYTINHTNAAIAGKRWYHYVIFDTSPVLGVDIKLIVRHDERLTQE